MQTTRVLLLVMSVTFILLAFQAEPITAFLGYASGLFLFISLLMSFRKGNDA